MQPIKPRTKKIMRKLHLILLLFVCQMTLAGNITVNEAMQKAQAFLSKQTARPTQGLRLAAKHHELTPNEVNDHYYVFNVGQQNGYVIVSSDDRTPAILGYANQGNFDCEQMPENMKAWLQSYADQLAYLESHPEAAIATTQLDEHEAVAPLLTSTWNQGDPYNRLCPKDNNKYCVTGCVATAMAQVLYYHKYPEQTKDTIPAYTTNTKKIKVNAVPVTTLDWAHMLDHYTGNESDEEIKAVATLMKVCGSATKMDYTSSSSGAYTNTMSQILMTYFDYDATASTINRDDFRANAWNNTIYEELANNRPVFYSGQSTGGGHAFVIDGYDKEGFFHVNWGWGSSCDGYFQLSILDPHDNSGIGASSSSDGYSLSQDATIGIKPNEGTVVEPEHIMTTSSIHAKNNKVTKRNGKFAVSINAGLWNRVKEGYSFDFGVGVYDLDNELVYSQKTGYTTLHYGWGWNSFDMNVNVPTLPDGDYVITLISREQGTTTWYQNKASDIYYISANVNGSTLTLQDPTVSLSGTAEVIGKHEMANIEEVNFTIKNDGSFFNNMVFLRVNDQLKGGRYFEIETNMTETLKMTFEPDSVGTNHIELCLRSYMQDENQNWIIVYTPFVSTDIEIEAAKPHSLKFSNGKVTNATKAKIIKDNTAKIQVDIKNNGAYDYDDNIRVHVYKWAEDNKFHWQFQVDAPAFVEAGSTNTVNMDVPGLTDGRYWFLITYKSEGVYLDTNSAYRDLYNYTVEVPDTPNSIIDIQTEHDQNVIFDLKGQKMTSPRKGLYIINGKKVIK